MPVIDELPIGAKIKFGAYSVSGETPHKICWLKAHHDNTLASEFIEDQFPFDAAEPENTITSRINWGSSRYAVSNVNQFLNAEGEEWWHPQTETDAPPPARCLKRPGFLHYFAPWEQEAIEVSEVETALPIVDIIEGGPHSEVISAKVFLPSQCNILGDTTGIVVEGEWWDLFQQGESLARRLSGQVNIYGECEEKPEEWESWYWAFRTPQRQRANTIRCINSFGQLGSSYASADAMGLLPCLRISAQTPVSDEPDDEGYYTVLEFPQEIIDIDEQDFLALLFGR